MTFFADADTRADPPREPYVRPPAWAGPPDDEVAVLLPITTYLARTPQTVLVLTSAQVFTTGVTLTVEWMLRRGEQNASDWAAVREAAMNHHAFASEPGAGGRLRFGVVFSDGRTARTTDASPYVWPSQAGEVSGTLEDGEVVGAPAGGDASAPAPATSAMSGAAAPAVDALEKPLLQLRGGGSGGGPERVTGTTTLWLYPVPPPGELRLVFEWPTAGIAESTVTLDGDAVSAAASGAEPVWPD